MRCARAATSGSALGEAFCGFLLGAQRKNGVCPERRVTTRGHRARRFHSGRRAALGGGVKEPHQGPPRVIETPVRATAPAPFTHRQSDFVDEPDDPELDDPELDDPESFEELEDEE